jgi:hypothetical protein
MLARESELVHSERIEEIRRSFWTQRSSTQAASSVGDSGRSEMRVLMVMRSRKRSGKREERQFLIAYLSDVR